MSAPFLVAVAPRVCACQSARAMTVAPGKELSRHRSYDRATLTADGYWNVYLAFFGDQVYWLEFTIVDTRDGRLLWRNGRPLEEINHGGLTHA